MNDFKTRNRNSALRRRFGRGPRGPRPAAGSERNVESMADPVVTRTVVVGNPQGLHARPAELFVKTASQYQARIEVIKDAQRVDGKSILNILTLAAVQGTELRIEASGPDAQAALDALSGLFERNFDVNGTVE